MRREGFEYRVIWQREGKPKRRAIYQTLEGAERCRDRQITASTEITWLPHGQQVPPLVSIDMESREVGNWG